MPIKVQNVCGNDYNMEDDLQVSNTLCETASPLVHSPPSSFANCSLLCLQRNRCPTSATTSSPLFSSQIETFHIGTEWALYIHTLLIFKIISSKKLLAAFGRDVASILRHGLHCAIIHFDLN